MPELNARNYLLDDLKKILFRAFPDFTGGHGGGGVSHKDRAKPFLHVCLPNDRLDDVGQVHHFFHVSGLNVQEFRQKVPALCVVTSQVHASPTNTLGRPSCSADHHCALTCIP